MVHLSVVFSGAKYVKSSLELELQGISSPPMWALEKNGSSPRAANALSFFQPTIANNHYNLKMGGTFN